MTGRLHSAACPFPGKYPLRLFYVADEKVVYHGKFHPAAWKFASKQALSGVYVIYDKAGPVVWGTNPLRLLCSTTLVYRYFGSSWVNEGLLRDSILQTVGPYRVYLNEGPTGNGSLDRARFIHYVNSSIASIRTI